MVTLAFDVYGTLIDTQGIKNVLAGALDDSSQAEKISLRWREKQLEYSFRRGLMDCYQPFSLCTRQALDYALMEAGVTLEAETKQVLLAAYRRLPAFGEALDLLNCLKGRPYRPFAFTNGEASVAMELLNHAGLLDALEGIVSVEVVRTFKPSPRVYQHFLQTTGSKPEDTWLISGNPFDILGAKSAGWRTAWIDRGKSVFDPWEETPDVIVPALSELPDQLGF